MGNEFRYYWAVSLSLKPLSVAALLLSTSLSVQPAFAAPPDHPYFKAQSLVIVIGATESESNGGVAPVAVDFNLLTPATSGSAATDLIGVDGYVFNSNAGFDAGHDFAGGAARLDIENETSGGNFGNPGGGDIDYLEASDSLTQFGLDSTTDVNTRHSRHVSRFLVVSNAPFDMFAQASNLTRTGDFTALDYENIGFRARINRRGGTGAGAWGSAAQNPSVGGSGLDNTLNDLGDFSAGPTKLFGAGRRTARYVGTLLEQAVSFNIRYALSNTADASNANAYDFSLGVGTIGADVTYTVYTP